MGYYLQAFIGKPKDIHAIKSTFDLSAVIPLKQNLTLIHLTEELFNQITGGVHSELIKGFEYLFTSIEANFIKLTNDFTIGYIEAFYWGGEGDQSAIIWANGKKIKQVISDQKYHTVTIPFLIA